MSQYSRQIQNHLSRSAGHLMTVKRMVEEERDYTEAYQVLTKEVVQDAEKRRKHQLEQLR